MIDRRAGSQAAWSLVMEGLASARVESHRLRQIIHRALDLVESSEAKEHLHQMAGDLIQAVPVRMDALDNDLDRTLLAMSDMGKDFLRARLPFSDKTMVDETLEGVPVAGPRPTIKESARRVALLHLHKKGR